MRLHCCNFACDFALACTFSKENKSFLFSKTCKLNAKSRAKFANVNAPLSMFCGKKSFFDDWNEKRVKNEYFWHQNFDKLRQMVFTTTASFLVSSKMSIKIGGTSCQTCLNAFILQTFLAPCHRVNLTFCQTTKWLNELPGMSKDRVTLKVDHRVRLSTLGPGWPEDL